MSDSRVASAPRNSLLSLAAVAGGLLGLFLLIGAYGHVAATWPAISGASNSTGAPSLALMLPGLVLAITGLVNIGSCLALWNGSRSLLQFVLAVNLLATVYLGYLLSEGVPDHPIGLFLALVASFVILLGAIRLGLTWPVRRHPPD